MHALSACTCMWALTEPPSHTGAGLLQGEIAVMASALTNLCTDTPEGMSALARTCHARSTLPASVGYSLTRLANNQQRLSVLNTALGCGQHGA